MGMGDQEGRGEKGCQKRGDERGREKMPAPVLLYLQWADML